MLAGYLASDGRLVFVDLRAGTRLYANRLDTTSRKRNFRLVEASDTEERSALGILSFGCKVLPNSFSGHGRPPNNSARVRSRISKAIKAKFQTVQAS